LNLLKKFGPKTPQDVLERIAIEFERANDKRKEKLGIIRGLFTDISELKEDDAKYKEIQLSIDETARVFFRHCWMTLAKYYKYMKHAKDNELVPDEITMKSAKNIQDSSFSWIESKLKEYGVTVDRNTEDAEDVRLKVENLMAEVGDYGIEKNDENTPEEDKRYADDDEDDTDDDDDTDDTDDDDDDDTDND